METNTPHQSSAISRAESSYIASLTKAPAFTSIVIELATATGRPLAAIVSLVNGPISTGTARDAQVSSVLAQLPPNARSYISSVVRAEESIVSRVLASGTNAPAYTPPTRSATKTSATKTTTKTSLLVGTSTAVSNSVPNDRMVSTAGVVVCFAGIVVLL